MKKCPVCGVMMGDNVAKCSMCKYDFQKASMGDTDKAIEEAANMLAAKDAENKSKTAERRSEEEKQLMALKERMQKEIDNLEAQYAEKKGKLDAEYEEMHRIALAEKDALEKDLADAKAQIDKTREVANKLRADTEAETTAKREQAQKEYDEMINHAKQEQQRIITEAQENTDALAVQVQQEFEEAMKKRDEILAEAKQAQDLVDNADKIIAEKEALIKDSEAKKAELEGAIKKLNDDFEAEKVRIDEESKKISMEQANEALRLKEEADAERRAINEEKDAIIADIEQRRADAQTELDQLVEQAKQVIADAEEAQKAKDEMDSIIAEAKACEGQMNEMKAQIADYEKQASDWDNKIKGIQGEYDEAVRIIADSKNATIQAEAIGQEIILAAEKQAVFLKEASLSESEKGKMLKLIEEKEQQIKDMEQQRDELIGKIEKMQQAISDLEQKMQNAPVGGKAILSDGPKEYKVEIVTHNASSEVDYEEIQEVLTRMAKDGWKLVSAINDEGGKLQSALTGSESASLSAGAFTSKEDRVVLIFERAVEA